MFLELRTNLMAFLVYFIRYIKKYIFLLIGKLFSSLFVICTINNFNILISSSTVNNPLRKKVFNYYCSKGFIINNKYNNSFGLSIKNIINNANKKNDHNFCILFTFLLKDISNGNNKNIIFSLLDKSNNKEILTLYIKGKNLYLRYFYKELVELKIMENVEYNYYYSFFFLYDKKEIKISINNKDKVIYKENKFEIPKEFNITIGYYNSESKKEKLYSIELFVLLLYFTN